jgi:hypothetical protein
MGLVAALSQQVALLSDPGALRNLVAFLSFSRITAT